MKRRRLGYAGFMAVVGIAVIAGTGFVHRQNSLDHPGVRAPYLQNDRGTDITLCWTTDFPATSRVELRMPDGSRREVGDLLPKTRHQVVLTGCRPGETHAYRTSVADSQWQVFTPRPAKPAPFRFAVFGDIGESSHSAQAVAGLLQRLKPEFAVALGDLAYPAGHERLLSERFFGPLSAYSRSHVVWHVFGNHDVATEKGRPLERASVGPDNGPPALPADRSYSFDYGEAHFTVVDSNLHVDQTRDIIAPWLERDLAASKARWKFVMLHHPPYSSGQHGGSQKVERRLVPIIARHGVDAVFAGHDHDYERFAPKTGVTYVVSGTGGAGLYRFRSETEGSLARTDDHHGLTLVEVDGDRATLKFIEEDGRILDHAEIPQNP